MFSCTNTLLSTLTFYKILSPAVCLIYRTDSGSLAFPLRFLFQPIPEWVFFFNSSQFSSVSKEDGIHIQARVCSPAVPQISVEHCVLIRDSLALQSEETVLELSSDRKWLKLHTHKNTLQTCQPGSKINDLFLFNQLPWVELRSSCWQISNTTQALEYGLHVSWKKVHGSWKKQLHSPFIYKQIMCITSTAEHNSSFCWCWLEKITLCQIQSHFISAALCQNL